MFSFLCCLSNLLNFNIIFGSLQIFFVFVLPYLKKLNKSCTNSWNSIISFGYVYWLIANKLSNFVSLLWKLHNRCCHILPACIQTCYLGRGVKYSRILSEGTFFKTFDNNPIAKITHFQSWPLSIICGQVQTWFFLHKKQLGI